MLLSKPPEQPKILPPKHNYLDVKITYACNYKCEYCYQADGNGVRQTGAISKSNARNLVKFVKKLNEKYYVTIAGGEPFVYLHLDYLCRELTTLGHKINMITNFSVPFEKIKKFIITAGKNIEAFSISIHIERIHDFEVFYTRLEKFVELKNILGLNFRPLLTCVLTEKNFVKLIEVDSVIKKRFNLPLEIQRVQYAGKFHTYTKEIEDFMKTRGLDIPEEEVGNINFFGRKCWAGSKFFYIESNGDVRRCYTNQKNPGYLHLGNLKKVHKIKVFDEPMPCLSADNGNCICHKHFVRQKFLTSYMATEKEIAKCLENVEEAVSPENKLDLKKWLKKVIKGE